MELDDYQSEAMRTALPTVRGSITYSMGGVGGEAGEYLDVVKKHLFHGKPRDEAAQEALLELGDLLWGVAHAAESWGFSLEEVAAANLGKLQSRYEEGTYIGREELSTLSREEIITRLTRRPREET